jgi:phage tail-like protein
MRGLVPELATPHPIGETLPALYRDDDLAQRLVSVMDAELAPVFASLDGFAAYLDPTYAPEDFLEWLGAWVGAALDQTWPLDRRRLMVESAVDLYRLRGTAAGLAAQVAVYTGGEVEVIESGAAGWSKVANAALPGEAAPSLLVRVTVRDSKNLSAPRLDELVAASKPAHIPHRVEIIEAGRGAHS